jgi:hypothetical protein
LDNLSGVFGGQTISIKDVSEKIWPVTFYTLRPYGSSITRQAGLNEPENPFGGDVSHMVANV